MLCDAQSTLAPAIPIIIKKKEKKRTLVQKGLAGFSDSCIDAWQTYSGFTAQLFRMRVTWNKTIKPLNWEQTFRLMLDFPSDYQRQFIAVNK